eukprot:CAMPEP_0119316806 /NCGR_PEP_ID=MMETSP1333-20130426/40944_1 /TAXON_ID=418940 /ORGANISM="Scyphosphaera apsteinii, Strain RCC1455" /LENGTH=333 /DNA_ID=CAMNT_0007322555 /DNA_START=111 /DNA_END=1109 /DNA_ORIENTATION=-
MHSQLYVFFCNRSDCALRLCWVDFAGRLHHNYAVAAGSTHRERCGAAGHVFLLYRATIDAEWYGSATDVPLDLVVGAYRAVLANHQVVVSGPDHSLVVTVEEGVTTADNTQTGVAPCSRTYLESRISGFTVWSESGVWHSFPKLLPAIEADLAAAAARLPAHAASSLRTQTALWVSLPGEARGGNCYHPCGAGRWLAAHGRRLDMAGGIELGNPEVFQTDRHLWGDGGLLLHELCHAYHDTQLEGGYNCAAWCANFDRAMRNGSYDAVAVHGPQGAAGPVRAYACTDAMEFWAELSVAFLCRDGSEYNKWFPHNYNQLAAHDPESCDLLHQLW